MIIPAKIKLDETQHSQLDGEDEETVSGDLDREVFLLPTNHHLFTDICTYIQGQTSQVGFHIFV
jgi:hypothetical protein